ncbi:MAG TPA: hypothetical protein DCL60_07845 [Armatimonadetes bacterium]|jgi:LacI family transcriptional regulator|nr:hypothetical protein [Armatimonadota bacterium]
MDKIMKITIRDVATDAGVSAKTVSRVLNNLPYVSADVRNRVWESVNKLGYTPDEAGKRLASMKSGGRVRTGNIGCVLFPSYEKYSEPYTAEILEELGKVLLEMNLHQYFCYTLEELADPSLFTRMVNPNMVDGCVLIGLSNQHQQDIIKIKNKIDCIVLVGLVNDNCVTSVHPDGVLGGYLGVKHLISLGHRRIGCVVGYSGHSDTELRLTGYKKALSEAGIEYDPKLVVGGKFSIEGAAEATKLLLKLSVPPTAIYSVSDPMAIGVYKMVQECGLRIPQDISVVGFDDIKLAAHLFPGLTTVGMDKYEMVKMAVQVLLDQIDGKSKSNMQITFPVKLVERNSCRRLE